MPPSSSYIPWALRRPTAASVVVSDTLCASSIPRLPPTLPLSVLIPQDRFTLLTLPSLLSILLSRKHTATFAAGDVHLDALSLLLPLSTPPLLSSRTLAHLPLTTTFSLLTTPQACHRNAAASIVVPKSLPPLLLSLIPQTRRIFLVLRRRLYHRR